MKRPLALTALCLFAAAAAHSQIQDPPSEDLAPPGEGERRLGAQAARLNSSVEADGGELARRRAEEAAADLPPENVMRAVNASFIEDPINKELDPRLHGKVTVYTAKRKDVRPDRRHLLVVPAIVSQRRLVIMPTVDCEIQKDKGLHQVGGRYLAAATEKGVFYSDLRRPASADAPCEVFVAAGIVRYGRRAAVQAVRTLDILEDALIQAGFSEKDARAAFANAQSVLGGREQFEIYGNEERLLATYPSKDGAGVRVFWPQILPEPASKTPPKYAGQ